MSRVRTGLTPASWRDEGPQEHVSRASRHASVPAAQVGDMRPIVSYGGFTPTLQGKATPPKTEPAS